jgi:hypothetical protein
LRERTSLPGLSACACAATIALAGCGGGERQDKNEASGDFKVEVTKASFPKKQSLAKASNMVIAVKNVSGKTIPNLAVTVRSFDRRVDDPTLADPSRPVFVVNTIPKGADTAYVDTYAFGRPLANGKTATFKWNVTAVKAGPYKLAYSVSGGLNGKAKAVLAGGTAPRGKFAGTISSKAPQSTIASDDKTVVNDGKKESKKTPAPVESQDAHLPPNESPSQTQDR